MKPSSRVALALTTVLAASCHAPINVERSAGSEVPTGEVWLTAAQVADAQIDVATVQEQDVSDTITAAGTIGLPDERTGHVFSPVTGRIVQVLAPIGARVKKGDGLAIIESPDVGDAVSDANKAAAALLAAEHDLKRKKELFEQQAASASDREASEDNYRRAKAEMDRAGLKERLLRVGDPNSVTQRYVVLSPIDGDVLARNVTLGVEVQGQYSGGTSPELFTIGGLDQVLVLGSVYEMDFGRVKLGAPVSVTVVAYPGKAFGGRVDWISSDVDPVTRTATVRCTLENVDHELRPMMYASVQISVDENRALAVPRSALLRVGDSKIVFVEQEKGSTLRRFRRVAVDVDDAKSGPWVEIKQGPSAGQNVVVSGSILLLANL